MLTRIRLPGNRQGLVQDSVLGLVLVYALEMLSGRLGRSEPSHVMRPVQLFFCQMVPVQATTKRVEHHQDQQKRLVF